MLLDDVIRPGLRVVFCGTALGAESARRKAYYAGRGNKFWPTLHEVGLTPHRIDPTDYPDILASELGLTDLCKSRSGSDAEVGRSGFDIGGLRRTIQTNAPAWLAFNGKNAAKEALDMESVSYGAQGNRFGGSRVFVLPSTSGAANRYWDISHWRELADLA